MEKNGIFNTDLSSLIGENPIEVDGIDDGSFQIPAVEVKKEEPEDTDKNKKPKKPEVETEEDESNLIDLESEEEKETDEEDIEEEDKETEEDKPSSKSKKQKPSSSPLTPYAKLLVEEGILPNMDIEAFDGTADGLKQAMVDEIIGAVNYYKESLPERVKDLINNYEEGVPLETLLNIDRDEVEVSSIKDEKVKEDPELQKQVVRNYLKRTSKFSDKKIDNMIQYYEDSGELESEAVSAVTELKEIVSKEKENAVKVAKQEQERLQKQAQQELAELNKKVQGIDEVIPGMKVNTKVKNELIKSMTTAAGKDRNGNPVNRIVAARMEDPMGFEIKLHYLFEITKGFTDFSKLTEKGKKDSIKEFEDAVEKQDRQSDGTMQHNETKVNQKFVDTITKTFNIR